MGIEDREWYRDELRRRDPGVNRPSWAAPPFSPPRDEPLWLATWVLVIVVGIVGALGIKIWWRAAHSPAALTQKIDAACRAGPGATDAASASAARRYRGANRWSLASTNPHGFSMRGQRDGDLQRRNRVFGRCRFDPGATFGKPARRRPHTVPNRHAPQRRCSHRT